MRLIRTLCAVLLVAALAGCTGGPVGSVAATSTPPGRPIAAGLINGFWRVSDAAGEPQPSWVQFTTHEVQLYRPKGSVFGAWSAQGDAIVVSLEGWSMSLGTAHDAPWLTATTTIAADGKAWVLRDATGRTAARLARGGVPTSSTSLVEETPIGSSTSGLRDAVPGPGVKTAPRAVLIGDWRLADHRDVTVRFSADGRWRTKPSCDSGTGANSTGGAYRVLGNGMLLMTVGASTSIGCSEAKAPSPNAKAITDLFRARSFSVSGDRLTLFDATGARIGTLAR